MTRRQSQRFGGVMTSLLVLWLCCRYVQIHPGRSGRSGATAGNDNVPALREKAIRP